MDQFDTSWTIALAQYAFMFCVTCLPVCTVLG